MNTKMIEDKLEIVVENEAMVMGTECCIYKVPTNLRRINEEAYTPQVISIGPFHHGKPELAYMETQKLAYQLQFRRRLCLTKEKMVNLWRFIERKEIDIRKCYRESTSKFDSCKFIKMILYDAIFIIEFFSTYYKQTEYTPLFSRIMQDLFLLENQVPYFILEELYCFSYSISSVLDHPPHPFFIKIVIWFFCGAQAVSNLSAFIDFSHPPDFFNDIKHFTDLLRTIQIGSYPLNKKSEAKGKILVSSTTKLQEAGIIFKKVYRFSPGDRAMKYDIEFENKVLYISHIKVNEQAESVIRNIMALEQCHYPSKPIFCTYISLLDCLINTDEDVNLLVTYEVIENRLGDNAAVATMVNRLCLGIVTKNLTCYDEMINDLNKHSKSVWNIRWANLKSVYFSNVWRGTGTIAATILLVLTFIQTIFTILSFYG